MSHVSPDSHVRLTRRQALLRGLGAGVGVYAGRALSFGAAPAKAADTLSPGRAFGLATLAIREADADALKSNLATRAAFTDMAILMPWRKDVATALKAANPNAKCLIYQNFGAVWSGSPPGTNPDPNPSCVVTYAQALAHDTPDPNTRWLLKDSYGKLIQPSDWPNLAYTNPAGTGYADTASANVASRLGTLGAPWDGVYLDDVNPAAGPKGGCWGVQNWATVLFNALGAFAAPLRKAGFLVIPNIGWLQGHAGWATYCEAAITDGVACEHFDHDVVGALGPLQWAASNGRYFIAITDLTDPTYALGGLMMGSADRRQLLCRSGSPVHPVCSTASTLGGPTRACTTWGSAYVRSFQAGSALIQPSTKLAAFKAG